jgi:hypothetical protein
MFFSESHVNPDRPQVFLALMDRMAGAREASEKQNHPEWATQELEPWQ